MIKVITGTPTQVEDEYNSFIKSDEVHYPTIIGTSESQGEEGFGITLVVEYQTEESWHDENHTKIHNMMVQVIESHVKNNISILDDIIDDYFDIDVDTDMHEFKTKFRELILPKFNK